MNLDYFDFGLMTIDEVAHECIGLSEEEITNYLAELASTIWDCPDRCDEWAIKYTDEIINTIADIQTEESFNYDGV